MNKAPEIIPCPEHPTDGKCGLCNNTGLQRLTTINFDDGTNTQMYVPSDLTQEEAQVEFERSLDILMNAFKISN